MKSSMMFFMMILTVSMRLTGMQTQQTGTLKGVVIDEVTRQPMIGANVSIPGTKLGASTDAEGRFIIPSLEEKVYTLQASFVGYTTETVNDVRIVRNKTTQVTIVLTEDYVKVGEVTAEVDAFELDKHAPVSKYTYSREEIMRSPGATGDIFRAIETLPGVSSSGGEFSAFSVRGGSPKENIVLVDNIPVDRLTHFEGGSEAQEAQGGRFSIFVPGLIQNAEFQAGGFPARYGGKNASLVDLTIRDPNRESPTLNGTYDLIGWEVNYNGPSFVNDQTGLVISGRHQNFRNILRMTGQKDLGDPSFTDLIVKSKTVLDGRNTLSLLGIYAPERFERNIEHVYESDRQLETNLYNLDETKTLGGLNWQLLTGSTSFLQTTLFYKGTDRTLAYGRAFTDQVNGVVPLREDAPQRRNIWSLDGKEREAGMKTLFSWIPSDGVTLAAGAEVSRSALDYTITQNGLDTVYTYYNNDYRSIPSRYYLVRRPEDVNSRIDEGKFSVAGYLENTLTVGNALVVNPGLRYERNEFNRKNYFSPRLSVSYALDPRTRLNTAGGVYYQVPDIRLFAVDALNASLEDERAIHAIAGVTHYVGDDLKLTVEGYYKKFDNLLVREDRTTERYRNSGDGWASGIDLGLVRRLSDNFYGQVNYSYAVSRRNDNDGNGWYNSSFNQPHIFNILAGYEVNSEWTVSAKWKYATGRPTDAYVVHPDVFNDPNFVRYSAEVVGKNADRMDDFHTLNIRVDYRKQFGRFALVSFLDVLNLYNSLNMNEARFLERSGEIVKKGFRVIPTIGMKLEI